VQVAPTLYLVPVAQVPPPAFVKSRFGEPWVRTPIVLSVAAVAIVNVSVVALLVEPMFTVPNAELGGGGAGGVLIVRASLADAVNVPDVPIMFTVTVPNVAEPLAVSVS
jgi:hypothetical protein